MDNKIRHAGIIESIDGTTVNVRITQTSACACCKVAHYCNASEVSEKIISAVSQKKGLQAGQSVTVSTSSESINKSLITSFLIPLILIISTIVITKLNGCSDIEAALASVGILLPFYLALWLVQKRITRNITFEIEDADE